MTAFSGFSDSIRLLLVLGCLALLGTNAALVLHAKRMFPRSMYPTWRIFFIGKSLLTFYVGFSAWQRIGTDYSWRLPVGLTGLFVTNYALFKLLKERGDEHGKEEDLVGPPLRDSGFTTESAQEADKREEEEGT